MMFPGQFIIYHNAEKFSEICLCNIFVVNWYFGMIMCSLVAFEWHEMSFIDIQR